MKLERVEKDRNELRLNTDRLESRVSLFACDTACWENVIKDWWSYTLSANDFTVGFASHTVCVSLSVCVTVQIAELLAELADERGTSESATQLLETETSERLRLEKDLKELQVHTFMTFHRKKTAISEKAFLVDVYLHMQIKFEVVKKQLESQEMEVMEARIMKTSELNGELNDNDDDAGQCSRGLPAIVERHPSIPQLA